ncbi:MAG: hypothetical protein Q9169_002732 [Polycauliona sp. 2 TL-2023]
MYLTATTIASLLVLGSYAAPQALPEGAADIVPPGTLRSPDECGPVTQGPNDPKDSCLAKPEVVTNGGASFGITKSYPEHGWELAGSLINWNPLCAPVIQQICDTMQLPDAKADSWYFATGAPSEAGWVCHVGFWLPNNAPFSPEPPTASQKRSEKRAPDSHPEAAPKPSGAQCSNIFGAMANAAADAVAAYLDNFDDAYVWSGASINLLQNPADQPGQFRLPGGQGTGKAVNSGYPSYIINVRNPNDY